MGVTTTVIDYDFNTSHVNVNLLEHSIHCTAHCHFNTSHVNVNRLLNTKLNMLNINFNTSHVNVNPLHRFQYQQQKNISIHLMLMLIVQNNSGKFVAFKFQYISC